MGASVRPEPRDRISAALEAAYSTPTPAAPQSTGGVDDALARAYSSPTTGAPAPSDEPPSRLGSMLRDTRDVARVAIGQGALGGFGDELEALVTSPFTHQTPAARWQDIQTQRQDFAQRAPAGMTGALELLGAMGTAHLPITRTTPEAVGTPLGRIGRGARTGLGVGAIYGAGKVGDQPGESAGLGARALGALEGGLWGAVGGTALGALLESGGALARSVDLGPKLASAVGDFLPRNRYTEGVQQRIAATRQRVADREALTGFSQDNLTPAQIAERAEAVHPEIPVAAADLAGESTRQRLGALKRVPGGPKAEIVEQIADREENMPAWMIGSLERNAPRAGGALGIPAEAGIDTRVANPFEVETAGRDALRALGNKLYEPAMEQSITYDPQSLKDMGRLLARPSMQRALKLGDELAREADESIGTLTLGEGKDAVTGKAPTVRQLHWLKMGLDEYINELDARIASVRAKGGKVGALATRLKLAGDTKAELLNTITAYAPEYATALEQYAPQAQALSAWTQGQNIAPGTRAAKVAFQMGELADNPAAQTTLGGGYTQRLISDVERTADNGRNPGAVVIGKGGPRGTRAQNLRTLVPEAPAIEADAQAIRGMGRTNAVVDKNSLTAERTAEDAAPMARAKAVFQAFTGRPLSAIDALLSTQSPGQAQANVQRLLLGASPGERQDLLAWLRSLEGSQAAKQLNYSTRHLSPRGVVAGYLGGQTAQ